MMVENVAGLLSALEQAGLDSGHVGAHEYRKVIAARLSELGVTAPTVTTPWERSELAQWIVEQVALCREQDEAGAWTRIDCLEQHPSVMGALLHASVALLGHTLDDAYAMAGADDEAARDVLVSQWGEEVVRRAVAAAEASHETTEAERNPSPCPTSFGGRCQCPGAVHEV